MIQRRFIRCAFGEQGLTLVELMVAIVMGFVLIAGVVTVFIANKQTYRMQDALARNQENARFAIMTMTRDIRNAGYLGCGTANRIPVHNSLKDSGGTSPFNFGTAIQGYDAPNANTAPTFPGVVATGSNTFVAPTPPPVPGSDILSLRTVGGCGDSITDHNPSSADIKTTPKGCLCSGDIVLVTRPGCTEGWLFQALNVTPDACSTKGNSSTKTNVVHNTGKDPKYEPGNEDKGDGTEWIGGEILRVVSRTYYVGDTGRGVRALYVTENGRPAVELVEGIESLQLEFGEDTDNDLAANAYRHASSVGNWLNVRSVRLSVLTQSADSQVTEQAVSSTFSLFYPTASDKRLREPFYTTVTARNLVP